jgi:hypothetical protein
MRRRRFLPVAACALLAACGSGPSTVAYGSPLGRFLLTVSEMGASGFTVQKAEHSVDAGWLSLTAAAPVRAAGFQSAVEVDFLRNAGDLSTSNGPVDVRAGVALFPSGDAAQTALSDEATGLLARPGAEEISTGVLGDSALATTELATFHGVQVVQITVVWRAANLLNSIVIHGRYGGARLDDALTLAHQQQGNVLRGGPPLPTSSQPPRASTTPSGSARPSGSPRPTPTP